MAESNEKIEWLRSDIQEVKQSLLRIERKLDDHKMIDHKEIEERLRAMEVWRGYVLGASAVIAAVVTYLVEWLKGGGG